MKYLLALFFLCTSYSIFANDGAFFAQGNQLIPIVETDIEIRKEILTIKKVDNGYVDISVDYTFFNPVEAKTILVGFEAMSPFGDVDGRPKNGGHPYMNDFTVLMNNDFLSFEKSIISNTTKQYYENGQFKDKDVSKEINDPYFNSNAPEFYYVYHFKAQFKSGINTIKHTYRYKMSTGILEEFGIDYVLTAANRWANQQIDDFTLILEGFDREYFTIPHTFFKDAHQWAFDGIVNTYEADKDYDIYKTAIFSIEFPERDSSKASTFFIKESALVFKALNFHPEGELHISKFRLVPFVNDKALCPEHEIFDPFLYALAPTFQKNKDPKLTEGIKAYKILRNLPFARIGYIFKTKYIQNYYETMPWYSPNEAYKGSFESLTPEEVFWMDNIKGL